MTGIEVNILKLMAEGIFVLISALCLASMLKDVMAAKGWRSARPILILLVWGLVTFLMVLIVFVLANAHTHVDESIMAIRMIALGYVLVGMVLVVFLVKQLRINRVRLD